MSDDLKPGWLGRDIARASARVTEWKEEKMGDNLKERLKNAPHEITKLALDRINLLEDAMRGATIVANASGARIAELEAQLKAGREALANLPEYLDGLECDLIALDLDFKLKDIVQPGIWADRVRAALAPKPTATGETP